MNVRYAKIGTSLLALDEVGGNHNDMEIVKKYECMWIINPIDINHIVKMLIEAGMVGVDPWRINQIRLFYEIRDIDLIKTAQIMNIDIETKNGTHTLSTTIQGLTYTSESKGDLLYGIIQLLVRTGYRIW